ncbi:MAG: hypothetical protein HN366_10815 [Deltaproteobacteria bacterium]|jgi:hypothetical protein|nr:hypothetical protein [Deltaproteobacteria bacterium]
MAQWYQHNHRLLREERSALADACPLMMLSVLGPEFSINSSLMTKTECAVAHGVYIRSAPDVHGEVEYGITLWLPEKYPKLPPILFCNDPKLPSNNIDRHILKNGQACLEVFPEINRRWPQGSNLVDFLDRLVEPFLAWQAYYDAFGEPPEWGERAHGKKGIVEYYADLIGEPADETIIGFMKLMARKNQPKGHEICPCGSGKKLRNCHYKTLECGRKLIAPNDVLKDLMQLKK